MLKGKKDIVRWEERYNLVISRLDKYTEDSFNNDIKNHWVAVEAEAVNIAFEMYRPCHSFYHCLPRLLPSIA